MSKMFSFFPSRLTDQSIVTQKLAKASSLAQTPIFFFPNFKALAYAGHMAEDGAKRSCVSRVLLFNHTVKRQARNDSSARTEQDLFTADQGEAHLFYQRMNDVFSSIKWWGNRNHDIRATDQNKLFRMLYRCYLDYHSLVSHIISHNYIFNSYNMWVSSQRIQSSSQCIPNPL